MRRNRSFNIKGKMLEEFSWPLQAAAAEAQFPFPGKGWPKAGVGTPAVAVRPLPLASLQKERGDISLLIRFFTTLSVDSSPSWGRPGGGQRNSDTHITTPPFGHPFLKKKGNWGHAGTVVPWREIKHGRGSRLVCATMFGNDRAVPKCPNN